MLADDCHCRVAVVRNLQHLQQGSFSQSATSLLVGQWVQFYVFAVCVRLTRATLPLTLLLLPSALPDKCSQVASMSSVVKLAQKDRVAVNIWGIGRNDVFAAEDGDTVFSGILVG